MTEAFHFSLHYRKDEERSTRTPAKVVSRNIKMQEEQENTRKEICPLHPQAYSHNLNECQLFVKKLWKNVAPQICNRKQTLFPVFTNSIS